MLQVEPLCQKCKNFILTEGECSERHHFEYNKVVVECEDFEEGEYDEYNNN